MLLPILCRTQTTSGRMNQPMEQGNELLWHNSIWDWCIDLAYVVLFACL